MVTRLQVCDVLRPVRAGYGCLGNHAEIVAAGSDTTAQFQHEIAAMCGVHHRVRVTGTRPEVMGSRSPRWRPRRRRLRPTTRSSAATWAASSGGAAATSSARAAPAGAGLDPDRLQRQVGAAHGVDQSAVAELGCLGLVRGRGGGQLGVAGRGSKRAWATSSGQPRSRASSCRAASRHA